MTRATSRLQNEFDRLFAPAPETPTGAADLIDPEGRVRALVLEVAAPADWNELAKVWGGVKVDLGLPAPAIAASGTDGLQLWFSLSEPLAVAAAHDWLDALRQRYLPELPAQRVRLWPSSADAASARHALPVPALHEATGHWSAFVASDLAPLFAETPGLDVPPGDDGQAHLLSGLSSIRPAELAAARAALTPPKEIDATTTAAHDGHPHTAPTPTHRVAANGPSDPVDFLRWVMNDASVPLALRIEAAKALLLQAPAR